MPNKEFKFFHVVEKTKGSSNEISFNVLESKKLNSEDSTSPDPWEISPENVSKKQKSNSGSWTISQEAVEKKRKKRQSGKALAIAGGALAVLALVTAAVLGVAGYMENTSGSMDKLHSQIKTVMTTSDELSEMRNTLQLLLKNNMSDLGSNITTTNLDALKTKAESAKTSLQKSKSDIESTLNEIATPAEKEAANNALTLINKELSLIDNYEQVYGYAEPFLTTRELAQEAMSLLVEADSKDREASQHLTSTDTEEVKKAITPAQESSSLATSAKQKINDIIYLNNQNSSLGIDAEVLQGYADYCDYIIAAGNATVAVANAYVDRDKETLTEQNDKYNELKNSAVEISKTWTTKLPDIIDANYESSRQSNAEGYDLDINERNSIYKVLQEYMSKSNS